MVEIEDLLEPGETITKQAGGSLFENVMYVKSASNHPTGKLVLTNRRLLFIPGAQIDFLQLLRKGDAVQIPLHTIIEVKKNWGENIDVQADKKYNFRGMKNSQEWVNSIERARKESQAYAPSEPPPQRPLRPHPTPVTNQREAQQQPHPLRPAAIGSCPNCGEPFKEGDKFCGKCGAELSAGPSVCPQCGAPVTPQDKFCRQCRAALKPQEKPESRITPPPTRPDLFRSKIWELANQAPAGSFLNFIDTRDRNIVFQINGCREEPNLLFNITHENPGEVRAEISSLTQKYPQAILEPQEFGYYIYISKNSLNEAVRISEILLERIYRVPRDNIELEIEK